MERQDDAIQEKTVTRQDKTRRQGHKTITKRKQGTCKTRQDNPGQDKTGQDKTRQGKARQGDKILQDNCRQLLEENYKTR